MVGSAGIALKWIDGGSYSSVGCQSPSKTASLQKLVATALPAGIHALMPVIRDWEADKRVGVYLVGPML